MGRVLQEQGSVRAALDTHHAAIISRRGARPTFANGVVDHGKSSTFVVDGHFIKAATGNDQWRVEREAKIAGTVRELLPLKIQTYLLPEEDFDIKQDPTTNETTAYLIVPALEPANLYTGSAIRLLDPQTRTYLAERSARLLSDFIFTRVSDEAAAAFPPEIEQSPWTRSLESFYSRFEARLEVVSHAAGSLFKEIGYPMPTEQDIEAMAMQMQTDLEYVSSCFPVRQNEYYLAINDPGPGNIYYGKPMKLLDTEHFYITDNPILGAFADVGKFYSRALSSLDFATAFALRMYDNILASFLNTGMEQGLAENVAFRFMRGAMLFGTLYLGKYADSEIGHPMLREWFIDAQRQGGHQQPLSLLSEYAQLKQLQSSTRLPAYTELPLQEVPSM